jgi:hypothetical protein
MYPVFLLALGMQSEGNAPKNGKPAVGFYVKRQCSSTLVVFGQEFLSKEQCGPSPYSSGLASADFYLFARLTRALKERRFWGATDIIKNATGVLKRLSQNGLQGYFHNLYSHW